jgi:hypothetical protein
MSAYVVNKITMEGREIHKLWYFILAKFLKGTEGDFMANIFESSGAKSVCISVHDGEIQYQFTP